MKEGCIMDNDTALAYAFRCLDASLLFIDADLSTVDGKFSDAETHGQGYTIRGCLGMAIEYLNDVLEKLG